MKKALVVCFYLVLLGCEEFDPPPWAELEAEHEGAVAGAAANPLIVRFSERIAPRTLTLSIVPDIRDAEGNLPDEQQPARRDEFLGSRLLVFQRGAPGDERATYTLVQARRLEIAPLSGNELPTAPLLLVVEPGLEDLEGNSSKVRIKIPFQVLVVEPPSDAGID